VGSKSLSEEILLEFLNNGLKKELFKKSMIKGTIMFDKYVFKIMISQLKNFAQTYIKI
jgi:hypothetical protein